MQKKRVKSSSKSITALIVNIGAVLEYYDFIVFPYLLPYISSVFFGEDELSSVIKSLVVFFAASVAKIFGVFVLNSFSNRFSSYYVMLVSIYLMSISTFLIGILPSYEYIGYFSSILVLILRFLQGIAYSIELPSASSFVHTYYKDEVYKRISHLIASTTIGAVLANVFVYLLIQLFSPAAIKGGLWRSLFIVSGIVGSYGVYIRIKFIKRKEYNFNVLSVKKVFKEIWENTNLSLSLLYIILPASLIIFYVFLPEVLAKNLDVSQRHAHIMSIVGLGFSIVVALFTGYYMKYKYQYYYKYCCYAFLIVYPVIWGMILLSQAIMTLLVFACLYQFFLTTFMIIGLRNINAAFKDSTISIVIVYNFSFIVASLLQMLSSYTNVFYLSSLTPVIIPMIICIGVIWERRKLV